MSDSRKTYITISFFLLFAFSACTSIDTKNRNVATTSEDNNERYYKSYFSDLYGGQKYVSKITFDRQGVPKSIAVKRVELDIIISSEALIDKSGFGRCYWIKKEFDQCFKTMDVKINEAFSGLEIDQLAIKSNSFFLKDTNTKEGKFILEITFSGSSESETLNFHRITKKEALAVWNNHDKLARELAGRKFRNTSSSNHQTQIIEFINKNEISLNQGKSTLRGVVVEGKLEENGDAEGEILYNKNHLWATFKLKGDRMKLIRSKLLSEWKSVEEDVPSWIMEFIEE